jgi:pSer/pThr/pTyr-binding forkhead associated (FHA) protein
LAIQAQIRITGGSLNGQTIEVDRAKLLIGREDDCHVRPGSEFVSRHHCAFLLDDYTLRIRDLGSKNGTFVNGRRVGAGEPILLHDDVVAIGEMTFLIDLNLVPDAPVDHQQPTPALEGTGIFDGDTAQADVSDIPPPSAEPTDKENQQRA